MNLYIINEVLTDWTHGMAVIAAPDMKRCRELFNDRFRERDSEFEDARFTVIEGVNHPEGVVSFVYGGA
jgi:hypothetical protein